MSATNINYLQAFLGILETLKNESQEKLNQELTGIRENYNRATTPNQQLTAESSRAVIEASELAVLILKEYKTLHAIALKAKFMRSAGPNFKFSDLDAESEDAFNRIRQVLIRKLNHPLIPDDPNLWIALHHMCVLKPINEKTFTNWSPTLKEDGSPQSGLLYLSCGRAYTMEELANFQRTQDLPEPVDFGVGARQGLHRYDTQAVTMNLLTRRTTPNTTPKFSFHCFLEALKHTFLELATSTLQTAAAFIGPGLGGIALKTVLAASLFMTAQMGLNAGRDKAERAEVWVQNRMMDQQYLDIHLAPQ